MSTPSEEEARALIEEALAQIGKAWDDGNATGLDGWVGPGRGAGEVDREAVHARTRFIHKAEAVLESILASRMSTPPARKVLIEAIAPHVYDGSGGGIGGQEFTEIVEEIADAVLAVSTPPSGPSLPRVLEAIAAQREWFTEASDDVLSRIKMDTTEDVMLYHDAVSVLVAARGVYDLIAGLAVSTPPSEDARVAGLREAADIADRMYAGTDGSALEKAWIGGCMATASAIRNRVQEIEGVPPVPAVPVPPTEPEKRMLLTHPHDGHGPNDTCRQCAPTEPETLAPMSPVFEEALTDDEWVERRLAAPTEPEEKR